MKLEDIRIVNYRALKDITFPLSHFVCITGENNSGKSSALQALSLFLSGSALPSSNFFDSSKEITITLRITGVDDNDLARLSAEHKPRIEAILDNGEIVLMRKYGTDGKSKLGYQGLAPIEARFDSEAIATLLKGKTGTALKETVITNFPELAERKAELTSQTIAKDLIQQIADGLPAERKQTKYIELPTGLDKSILPMLPERVYIPAVKDLADDIKTAESSTFGKILAIVMRAIEPALSEEQDLFEKLSRKLTRIMGPDGNITDDRLQQLKDIECLMGGFVRESFSNVKLEIEIPPPELKTVLSTARLFADDGVRGPLELKGDGLRRAVVFSILRTYVEMARAEEANEGGANVTTRSYLLLFEEPELFLHPSAQRILFDALGVFAERHHVVVTTHSPLFLGPSATATFVRLVKTTQAGVPKPFTQARPVDLSGIKPKDEFQLICFENNNAAFFARKVVLVEGDSDQIVFPHVASMLNPTWLSGEKSIAFVRVSGKGSIERYRSFFKRFQVPVQVITDLDTIEEGFEKLDPTEQAKELREALLAKVDGVLRAAGTTAGVPRTDDIRTAHGRNELKELWVKVREARAAFDADPASFEGLKTSVDEFFAWEAKHLRRSCIQLAEQNEVKSAKLDLLWELRKNGVFVLERGTLEDYYPAAITGADKPSKAQSFCATITSREQVIGLSSLQTHPETCQESTELEFICASVFE